MKQYAIRTSSLVAVLVLTILAFVALTSLAIGVFGIANVMLLGLGPLILTSIPIWLLTFFGEKERPRLLIIDRLLSGVLASVLVSWVWAEAEPGLFLKLTLTLVFSVIAFASFYRGTKFLFVRCDDA